MPHFFMYVLVLVTIGRCFVLSSPTPERQSIVIVDNPEIFTNSIKKLYENKIFTQKATETFVNIGTKRFYIMPRSDQVRSLGKSAGVQHVFDSKPMFLIEPIVSEPNGPQKYSNVTTQKVEAVPWGLIRITHRKMGESTQFSPPQNAGKGVTVFVLDGGADGDHPELAGKVSYKDVGLGTKGARSHGTHVCGSIAGNTVGVAKDAKIISIKITKDDGTGSVDTAIKALGMVSEHAKANKGKYVVNLSVTVGRDNPDPLDTAIQELTKMGIIVVAAAGNSAEDACKYSPAFSKDAITVGAIDQNDSMTDFTNFGKCVDIMAPGKDIKSSGLDKKYENKSGTSMSTPYVSGVAAAYLSAGLSPEEVQKVIREGGSKGMIKSLKEGTKNAIVFLSSTGKQPENGSGGENNGKSGKSKGKPV